MRKFVSKKIMLLSAALVMGVTAVLPIHSRSLSSDVLEAQTIMTKFGLPTGPKDGKWGPQTARGTCAFRMMAGLPVSRGTLTASDMSALRSFDAKYSSISQIPAPNKGLASYLDLSKTCQAMAYVQGNYYQKVMPVSTGKPGFDYLRKPSYSVGNTARGWHCSGQYPETCTTLNVGESSSISNFGNMYNRRHVTGGIYVHGSMSVPTAPASHGCIRVTVADSDWMYHHVGNNGDEIMFVSGSY